MSRWFTPRFVNIIYVQLYHTFFSRSSLRLVSFFSSSKFLKFPFCCTSWMAFTNLVYNSSLSFCVCSNRWCNTSCSHCNLRSSSSCTRRRALQLWKWRRIINHIFHLRIFIDGPIYRLLCKVADTKFRLGELGVHSSPWPVAHWETIMSLLHLVFTH